MTQPVDPNRASLEENPHPPAIEHLKKVIMSSLEEDKAEEIVAIDLTGKSDMADYMVIATGRSNRHVGAIADKLVERLKKEGIHQIAIEGVPHCDWVLIDTFDIVIHLFRPEIREIYNLEKMWKVHLPSSSSE